MKVVESFPPVPDFVEDEWEDSRGQNSSEETVMMPMFRVTVMEGDFSVQSDFLVPEAHPIDMVLESRSWMDDVSSAARTDGDDEMRREMERLVYAEKELRHEIRGAAELHEKGIAESAWDGPSKILTRKIEIDLIEGDARDSRDSSQPSDEACNGEEEESSEQDISEDLLLPSFIMRSQTKHKTEEPGIQGSPRDGEKAYYGMIVRGKKPPKGSPGYPTLIHRIPEECSEDISTGVKNHTDDCQSICDDPSLTLSALMVQESAGKEANELLSTDQGFGNTTEECDEEREEAPTTMSDWAVKIALQMPDLEWGRNKDLFEEELFWEDGFWKSASENPDDGEAYSQNGSERGNVSTPSGDSNKEEVELSSVLEYKEDPREQNQSYRPEWERSHDSNSCLEISNSDEGWTEEWKSPCLVSEPCVDALSFQLEENIHDEKSPAGDLQSHLDMEDTFLRGDDEDNKSWCTFRRSVLIIAVHVFFIVVGFMLLAKFIKISGNPTYQPYPSPGNDECIDSLEYQLSVNSSKRGTFRGTTPKKSTCHESDHENVWYSVIGTGGPLFASTAETKADLSISLLTGSCDDLDCIGDSDGSSVAWTSQSGSIYHLLVHGEPSADKEFSISLGETTLNNSACEKSTSILFPVDGGRISVAGTIDPQTESDHALITCDFVSDAGAGAWYSLLGNGSYMTASICAGSIGASESHIRLFSGPCSDLECVSDHSDPTSPIEPRTSVSWVSKQEETYRIHVSSLGMNKVDFELCIDQSEIGVTCEASIPVFFDTDDGSIDIYGNTGESQTHSFVSNETELGSIYCNGGSLMSSSVMWYSIVGTGHPIAATTCGENGENVTAIFDVMTGRCNALECISNGTTASCGASGQQYLEWDTVLGLQYWIVVSSDTPQGSGRFILNLRSAGGIIEQDEENFNLPVTTTDKTPTPSIWIYVLLAGIFAAFALIAWKWRRLKRIRG